MAKLNKKTFKEAAKDSGGNQARIAQRLELSRQAVNQYVMRHPKLREILNMEAETVIDIAEDNVDTDIVIAKDIDTSKWKLLHSKRGKDRGYGPKSELELQGSEEKKLILEIVHARDKTKDESPDGDSKSK